MVAAAGGKVVIETGGAVLELRAGIPGVITQTIGTRGVVIRATGGLVQGVWGNGKLDYGMMQSVMDGPEDLFDPARIDVSLRAHDFARRACRIAKVFQNA